MASNTPNIGAPLWDAAQATPWLTLNKAGRFWDAFAVTVIVDEMDRTAPPGSCGDGARYLVQGVATGLWAGHEGDLAIAVGVNASNGWYFAEVSIEGMLLYNRADSHNYRYHSGAWRAFADAVSRFQDLLDVSLTGLVDGDVFVWDASNGVLFPLTVSSLVSPLLSSYLQATLDTDGTLAANSDVRVPSQKAVKTAIAAAIVGLLDLKGATDCSANPNYPAAVKGDYYVVTVAGKIGGASGATVSVGDVYFAVADNAGGTQAGVGTSWDILVHASVAAGGGLLAANNLSDLASAATARANLGLVIGTDVPARSPSIQSVVSSATVTPTFSNDSVIITAQAAGLTLANPTGTAVDEWGISIRIKDDGTARSISYGGQYRALGVTLPTTTVISKTLRLGMIFNNADTKWDVVAVAQEA